MDADLHRETKLHRVEANGTELAVVTAGEGPAVLLMHGWPHTHDLWNLVLPQLARTRRVIAPDLRGLGGSRRETDGYDLHTLADDMAGLLDALAVDQADVVAIDAGTPPAFMLAMRAPQRVRRLVLMESLLGTLPGAESFLRGGPPWWFGFHQVPGLAETVLVGREAEYLDWFLRAGTHDGTGVPGPVRDAFVAAYAGAEALRCGFEYYRAMPVNARQIADAVAVGRPGVPTMAIGARPVGDALFRQLEPVADRLTGQLIDHCGHLIPLDAPEEFLRLVQPFLG